MKRFAVDLGISAVLAMLILVVLGAAEHRSAAERERARLEPTIGAIRDGFGSEVVLARQGAGGIDAKTSVDSVVRFIAARADFTLDPEIAARLAALEERTLRGDARRLSPDDVAAVLSATLLERIRDCSDDEIEHAADGFGNSVRTFPVEGLGDGEEAIQAAGMIARRMRGVAQDDAKLATTSAATQRNGVTLRSDGRGFMRAEQFVERVKTLRENLQVPQFYAMATGSVRDAIRADLDERLALFGEALPAAWGGAASDGLSPVQVLLMAYSAASDDRLVYPTPALQRATAERFERYIGRVRNAPRVASKRSAFGLYGDIFSSPLDLAFDRNTLARLLDRVEERTAR